MNAAEPFDLPKHQWRHIVAKGPDGDGYYPGVQWGVCERCLKAGEFGVGPEQMPEPGTCWGKKPLTEEQTVLLEMAMGIILGRRRGR